MRVADSVAATGPVQTRVAALQDKERQQLYQSSSAAGPSWSTAGWCGQHKCAAKPVITSMTTLQHKITTLMAYDTFEAS
jgi:uncharacterized low-complexity protein